MIENITIGKVNTKPEMDPYHADTGKPTQTVIDFDPATGIVEVEQECDSGSTTSKRFNHEMIYWRLYGHPHEDTMREWIEHRIPEFIAIANGHSMIWNGNDHVGKMTDSAKDAEDSITHELAHGGEPENHYSFWRLDDWMNDIKYEAVGKTDVELREMAREIVNDYEIEGVFLDNDSVEDAYKILVDYRDEQGE